MSSWFLEGYFEADNTLRQLPVGQLPQTVGRDEALSCYLPSSSVSRRHALLELKDGCLWIKDLGSSNGTFVNRHRITGATLVSHGDVIHLGKVELRLIDRQHATTIIEEEQPETTFIKDPSLSAHFPYGVAELEELIRNGMIEMMFQPIVGPSRSANYGYEILGRGALPSLPTSPLELFRIAESVGLDIVLSDLMRNTGVAVAAKSGLKGVLLINTHPRELAYPEMLLHSLSKLRHRHTNQDLMLEIHEKSVADIEVLKYIKRELEKLQIKFAFDDFGVGQSRLMDMVEAKPDLIKFDRIMIDSIDQAGPSRISLLKSLKKLAVDLDIQTLAECVSSEGEFDVCRSMDFDLYQGYLFGKPQRVAQIAA